MEELINTAQPPLECEPYLDDLTCHGNTLEEVWQATLRCLDVVTQEGIMINMKKCKFLVRRF